MHVTSRLKKVLFALAGMLSVAVGAVGAFVPLLPTVPFLLLAAYFFAKSSQRMYNWLHTNRWFGKSLRDYREGKGISVRAKVFSIALMWVVVGYSLLSLIESSAGKIIMFVVGIGVTIHLLSIKSQRKSVGADREEPSATSTT